jgi:hypothetical protein
MNNATTQTMMITMTFGVVNSKFSGVSFTGGTTNTVTSPPVEF